MSTNPQLSTDLVTFTEKSSMENLIFCAMKNNYSNVVFGLFKSARKKNISKLYMIAKGH